MNRVQSTNWINIDLCLSRLGVCGGHSFDEAAALAEQSSPRY
jgi:hypothetical protein